MKKGKSFIYICLSLMFLLVACNQEESQPDEGVDQIDEDVSQSEGSADETDGLTDESTYPNNVEENPIVTITMEDESKIIVELYPEIAPNTVANFVSLVEDGFYDELIFHRVIPGFMIQGGDPVGNGTGGPGYSIAGEFSLNDFENSLEHDKGVISMARSQHPDSAGSQFFIMAENSPHLDGEYAAFGEVIEGIEFVDEIVAVDRDGQDKPLEDQQISEVTVDTKGYDYPSPETFE